MGWIGERVRPSDKVDGTDTKIENFGSTVSKADDYRNRADSLAGALRKRTARAGAPILRKKQALIAMAENEDWLDGKSGTPTTRASARKRGRPKPV